MMIFIVALASFPVLLALGTFLPNEQYFTSIKDTPAYKERVSALYDTPFLEAFPAISGLLKSAGNQLDSASKTRSPKHSRFHIDERNFSALAQLDFSDGSFLYYRYCYGCCIAKDADVAGVLDLIGVARRVVFNNALVNPVRNYFTANNYLHAKEILQSSIVGAITGLVINVASAPLTSTIFKSTSEQTSGRIETNSNTSSEVPAHDYASAAETFCLAIQAAKIAETEGLDSAEGLSNGIEENRQGRAGITKEFILAQAGSFGPICSSYGVTWQRRSGTDSS
ncbi:hypothetical protein B0O99DRAFT_336988 [Bisporella sp. PMI_857]|nr:hypothetical protein B0O99DRAFT_336988 [Bisporella sp. PMI_857]